MASTTSTQDNFSPSSKMFRQLIIVGAGGHAISLANVAISAGYEIECFVDKHPKVPSLVGIKVISDLAEINCLDDFDFGIAVGDNATRELIYNKLKVKYANLNYPTLIHKSAIISSFSNIQMGTVIMPGAVVGPNSNIGKFCLINTQSSIDHDCLMGDFSSLAPATTTGGAVNIGTRSAISIGSTIKHGVKIGGDCVVGANSYVNKDLPSNTIAYGSPAKIIRTRNTGDPYLF